MSGGVDSSVAAYLMQQRGFDCTGITLKLFDSETDAAPGEKTCCSLDDVEDARSVCRRLGIPHFVYNFKDSFAENVIARFIRAYETGCTPNPCIDCNRYIKFDKLIRRAEELDFDCVVTGHYARVEYDDISGRWLLKKARDLSKDQSYVLYCLTQEQLAHVRFPLGVMTKAEARATSRPARYALCAVAVTAFCSRAVAPAARTVRRLIRMPSLPQPRAWARSRIP